jgi:beta-lactamase class A
MQKEKAKGARLVSIAMRYAIAGSLAGALIAGVLVHYLDTQSAVALRVVRESDIASSSAYTLTDPLISVSENPPDGGPAPEYAAAYSSVNAYIASEKGSGLISASVNFRDIDASDGFTIDPDTLYDPASLTKVPLAMAYYSLAEADPSVLDQLVAYKNAPDLDSDEQIESPVQLAAGRTYTVEDLIEHMIKYSDNNAEQLLADHLSSIGQLSVLSTLFQDFGITQSDPNNPDDTTVGSYSLFLRVLYNATYLDRDYSEQLLSILTQSDFTKGIEAGVPNGVLIAQKFGDARIPNAQGQQVGAELQNCGIVYYPAHPYILCVMTKGSTISLLENTIAGISQIVYQNIEKRYSS